MRTKTTLLVIAILTSISCNALNYFWVGGSGNWSDFNNHWATTSGGNTFHNQVPQSTDNVFFDALSFTPAMRTVTVDQGIIQCADMIWAGLPTMPPIFNGNTSDTLRIFGSLTLATGMNFNFNGQVSMEAITAKTITTSGTIINASLTFNGIGGSWILQDALRVTNVIYLNNGNLNTNNKNVNSSAFYSNTVSARSLYMGSSIFNLSGYNGVVWAINPAGMVLDAGTSIINGIGNGGSFTGGGFTYNDLFFTGIGFGNIYDNNTFHDVSFASDGVIFGSNTFHDVSFGGNATIYGNPMFGPNTFNNVTIAKNGTFWSSNIFNNLSFSPGYTYTLQAEQTQTVGNICAQGSAALPIRIQSSAVGLPAIISKASGTLCWDYVRVSDITATGGAIYNAGLAPTNSQDLGGNIGLLFTGDCTFVSCIPCSPPSVTTNPTPMGVCAGVNVTFSILANGINLIYQWQVNQGSGFINLSNIAPYYGVTSNLLGITSVTTALNGFQYRCVVSSGTCTSTSGAATLNVNQSPIVTVNSATICSGQSATLTANGATTYTWTTGTGLPPLPPAPPPPLTGNPISVSPLITSTYTVKGTANGCSNTAIATVTVYPMPAISAGQDATIASNTPVQLGSAFIPAFSYSWSPTTGLSNANVSNPTLILQNSGSTPQTFTYILNATNGQCSKTDTVLITVLTNCVYAIPFANTNSSITNISLTGTEKWFSFIADNANQRIELKKNPASLGHIHTLGFYSGTCSNLNLIDSVNITPVNDTLLVLNENNLTAGSTYFIKVSRKAATCNPCTNNPATFDMRLRVSSLFELGCGGATEADMGERALSCPASSTAYATRYGRFSGHVPIPNVTPVKIIKISFHFFQKNDSSNSWPNDASTLSRINDVVYNWMNNRMAGLSDPSDPIAGVSIIPNSTIQYEVTGIHFYQNDNLNSQNAVCGTAAPYESFVNAIDPSRISSSIPIYVTSGPICGGGPLGFGISPSESNFNQNAYVVTGIGTAAPGEEYFVAGHLVHELGHDVDLHHTYDSEELNTLSLEYLSDVFNVTWMNYCNPPANYACYHLGGWNSDPFSTTFNDYSTNNLMGATKFNQYLSPLQLGKINRSLAIKSVRKYVKEMQSSTNAWVVNQNETWDFDIHMYQDIFVTNNATLTIKCNVGMANLGRIIVDRGATLIVDGGNITSIWKMWYGIELWGNKTKSQFPTGGVQYQGKVILKNDAIIENARIGIYTYKLTPFGAPIGYFSGGIIQANNATFKNCVKDIEYRSYQNFYPANGIVANNIGSFKNCKFLTTGQLKDATLKPYAFVALYDVQGIRFLGNIFKNTAAINQNQGYKGVGIISVDANYSVNSYCTSIQSLGYPCPPANAVRNHFENLVYGVHASAGMSPLKALTINNSEFVNNDFGVYVKGVFNPTITSNTFDVAGSFISYGVYIDNSTRFKLEDNHFTTSHSGYIGSYINNSVNNSQSNANTVYNNYYENLFVGNIAANDNYDNTNNLGLKINCDDFTTGNRFDNAVIPMENPYTDIDPYQGTCTSDRKTLVRNQYSAPCAANENQYYIEKSSTLPIYHNNSTESWAEPVCKDVLVLTNDCNFTRDRASDCPSTLGNTYSTIKSEIALINGKVSQLKPILDAGAATSLISAINSPMPVGTLKNVLMSKSPYLSDAVSIAYVKKANTPPPGHLKDIIIANSPVTTPVKDALNTISLPTGIRNQINAAQIGISERTKLEGQIAVLSSDKDMLISDNIGLFLNDTLISNPMDSVIKILKEENRINTKAILIDAYIEKNDFVNAQQEINTMRATGNMNDLCDFKELVLNLQQSVEGAYKMQTDSVLKTQIEALANDPTKGSSKWAQALLQKVFESSFQEEVLLPFNGGTRSMQIIDTTAQSKALGTKVYPNPAQNSINFEVDFETEDLVNSFLIITDVVGRQKGKYNIPAKNSPLVVNTETYSNGIYFYSLYNNGILKETEKFIISK